MEKKKSNLSRNIIITGILWVITLLTCLLFLKEMEFSKPVGIILAFLPAITFSFFLIFFIKGIAGMDELERRIQLEAMVIAFALTFILLMTLGLLDLVVNLKKEDWSYRHVIPYLFTFYLAGIFISRRKYL